MTEGATDRKQGFNELLARDGETMTFREADVVMLVNRGMPATKGEYGRLNFLSSDQSVIEFLKEVVSSAPVAGEDAVDEFALHHRIQTIRQTEFTYRCECNTEDAV